jgi:hypothetical protein
MKLMGEEDYIRIAVVAFLLGVTLSYITAVVV